MKLVAVSRLQYLNGVEHWDFIAVFDSLERAKEEIKKDAMKYGVHPSKVDKYIEDNYECIETTLNQL